MSITHHHWLLEDRNVRIKYPLSDFIICMARPESASSEGGSVIYVYPRIIAALKSICNTLLYHESAKIGRAYLDTPDAPHGSDSGCYVFYNRSHADVIDE